MKAVTVDHLSKKFATKEAAVQAVSELSFDVEKGELFGIIGPDGAGKTTLFRMLCTLLLPDNGIATVDGSDIVKDYVAIRNKVGYMPERFSLYQDLTVAENLQFFATIFKTSIEENYDLVKDIYVQIEPFKNRRAGKLSGGMKQKLALSCALIHRPVVLFLDEPTTGVDAVSRKEFWEMLKKLQQKGISIVVSTPYMDEASLCDKVVLVQAGQLLTQGSPQQITNKFRATILAVRAAKMFQLLQDLENWKEVDNVYAFGEYHHAVMKENYSREDLQQFLVQKGHQQVEMHIAKPNIEDCFMQLMRN